MEMEKLVKHTENRLDRIENEKRHNNIVVQGIQINTTNKKDLVEEMSKFLDEELDVEAKVYEAIKLGEKTCLIKLSNGNDKPGSVVVNSLFSTVGSH